MVSVSDRPIGALEPYHGLLSTILDRIARLSGVDRVVLYGSYAKGTQSDESDLDLAVFFDSTKPCLLDEYRALNKICVNAELDIQVQAFHAFELLEPCGIIEEIDTFGIELYPA